MSTVEVSVLADAKEDQTVSAASPRALTRKEIVSYGFGDFGNGFMFDLGQYYLLQFWTGEGIGAAIVTAIMAGTKIFDAFMDPIAAGWIDSRKVGKRGKFRPVMLNGAVALAIVTIITFTMPQFSLEGKIAWALIGYMLWGVAYAFTNNPYQSLASVMTRNVEERAQLATSRQAGSLGAQWITGFAFLPLLVWLGGGSSTSPFAWVVASLIMAAVGVGAFFVCYKGTRERVKVMREVGYQKNSLKDYAKVVFTNRPLGGLILMTLFTISAMNVYNSMMVFYAKYNLGNLLLASLINLIMIGSSIVTILFIPKLVKKFNKKKVAIAGLLIGGGAAFLNGILPTNFWMFVILVTISYAGLAIPNGVTWAFVADTMDFAEWNTGVRKEAIVSAAFNFSRKLAQTLAVVVGGGVLALTGYSAAKASQSPETLAGIKAVMCWYPALALILAAVMLVVVYNLSDKKYNKIAADLDNGLWRGGRIADLLQPSAAGSVGKAGSDGKKPS
jgi:GPH family glycoside/pentoside/hexuronide:cation symporter